MCGVWSRVWSVECQSVEYGVSECGAAWLKDKSSRGTILPPEIKPLGEGNFQGSPGLQTGIEGGTSTARDRMKDG